jgi:subtilisin family serine protease
LFLVTIKADIVQFDPALKQLLLQTTGSPSGESISEDAGTRKVPVVARLVDPTIEVEGLNFITRFGHIATGRVRLDQLIAVHEHPNVASLKASTVVGAALAYSVPEIHASANLLKTEFSPNGFTGRGVIIAFLDWGCDFAHANLRNFQGGTRLLCLWDQRGGPRPDSPAPYGYGRLISREQIDDALSQPDPYAALDYDPAQSDDGTGTHCTHVMDIAAGNGQAPGSSPGVAPEADLICVHLKGDDTQPEDTLGDSVRVLEAVRFIVDFAGNRPLVINLSLGKTGGPHDQTLLVTQALDELLEEKPGCMVVMSTGNYFVANIHSNGKLNSGDTVDLRWNVTQTSDEYSEMEVWYPGSDRFTVELISPTAESLGIVTLGNDHVVRDGEEIIASIYHREQDPNNGDHQIDIFISPHAPSGVWVTRLHGEEVNDGNYHAWIERARPMSQARFEPKSATPTYTTGTICNGLKTIAVGAYDARLQSVPLGHFSSAGPTRDGRVDMPTISAPGVAIRAARSSYLTPFGRIMNDLTVKSGTSMAAPHVSGVVALMFEAAGNYRLTADQTREILISASREEPKDLEHQRYGAGRVDAVEAIKRVCKLIQNQADQYSVLIKKEEETPVLVQEITLQTPLIDLSQQLNHPQVFEQVFRHARQERKSMMNKNLESSYSSQPVSLELRNRSGSIGNSDCDSCNNGLRNIQPPIDGAFQWLLQNAQEALVQLPSFWPSIGEHAAEAWTKTNSETSTVVEQVPPFPYVSATNFVNSGTTHADNCCDICPINLGVGVDGMARNGMEIQFTISGHRIGMEYEITRTRRNSLWEHRAGVWTSLESDPMGTRDDHHDHDECLTIRGNRIFVIDRPGWNIPLPAPSGQIFGGLRAATHADATEVVLRASFAEWAMARNKNEGIPWTPLELPPLPNGTPRRLFFWHSITWLARNAAGDWVLNAAHSEIRRGSLSATVINSAPAP